MWWVDYFCVDSRSIPSKHLELPTMASSSSGSGADTIFQIFTNNISESMDALLTQCTQNNDIQSDANILKVKEHTDHVLRQFRHHWGIVSGMLHEQVPELEHAISIDVRKREMAQSLGNEIQLKEEKLTKLKQRVHALRSQVPQQLADENAAPTNS